MSQLLAALRACTRDQHAALDSAFPSTPSRAQYVAFLRAQLAIATRLEPLLARWKPELVEPSRAERIAADLAALGEAPRTDSVTGAVDDSRGGAVGIAYVVEGASLGGMVLADRYEKALALPHGQATSFLRLRGPGTGARWKWFLGELAHVEAELAADEQDAACRAATATFAMYADAFRRNEVFA